MWGRPVCESTTTVIHIRIVHLSWDADSPMTSHPKPRKSLKVLKYPPHDLSHHSVPVDSNKPLSVSGATSWVEGGKEHTSRQHRSSASRRQSPVRCHISCYLPWLTNGLAWPPILLCCLFPTQIGARMVGQGGRSRRVFGVGTKRLLYKSFTEISTCTSDVE